MDESLWERSRRMRLDVDLRWGRPQVEVSVSVQIPGDLAAGADGDLSQRLAVELRLAADRFFDEERRRRDEARAETAEDAARALERTEAEQMLKVKLAEIRAEATAKAARETAARVEAGERRLAEAKARATRPPADSGAALAQAIWDAFRRGDPFALQNMFIPITPGDLLRLWRDEAFLVALSAALEAGDDPAAATRQLIAAHLAPTEQAPPVRHWGLVPELPPATLNLPALDLADDGPDAQTEVPGDAERRRQAHIARLRDEAEAIAAAAGERGAALCRAISEKVGAALLVGRRVNVVELGRAEAALLGVEAARGTNWYLDDGQAVGLTLRPADADSALSVYYDPDIATD